MSSFEVLTRESFEALEAQQARHAMQRLDDMMARLQDLEEFLDAFLRGNTE